MRLLCGDTDTEGNEHHHSRTTEHQEKWRNEQSEQEKERLASLLNEIGEATDKQEKTERIPHHCMICQEQDTTVLEVHHIDSDHTNNSYENLVVLCANDHLRAQKNPELLNRVDLTKDRGFIETEKHYKTREEIDRRAKRHHTREENNIPSIPPPATFP